MGTSKKQLPDRVAEWVIVTPDVANEWLMENDANRNLRPMRVKMLASDMLNGLWQPNGETIKFDSQGKLLDGQHRLSAVVAAGEENPDFQIELLVVRGVDSTTQMTMDIGAHRSFADQLTIRGVSNPATVAAILRRIALWEKENYRQSGGSLISHQTLAVYFERFKDEIEDIAADSLRCARGADMPASVIGLAMWLFYAIHAEDAEKFFQLLETGEDLTKDHPILRLRESVRNGRTVKRSGAQTQLLAVVIKAWNYYRDGERIQNLSWRGGGASPENFPLPH